MSDTQILPKPGIFRTVLLSRSLTIGTLITVILVAMALISFSGLLFADGDEFPRQVAGAKPQSSVRHG